jgi:putative cell wall-binding protein
VVRRVAIVAGLVALALAAVPDARAASSVERLAGPTRYDTAIAVAEVLHPNGASTAVVASGTSYADALTAGVAASALDAPLLLASDASVPTEALQANGVDDVVLIGGTAALSDSVAFRIADATGAHVRRLAGLDRFETAAAVAKATAADGAPVIEAPGEVFETALVAAVHAARLGARLDLRDDLDDDEIVDDGVALHGAPGDLNLQLLERDPTSATTAVVATIASFPDALSAAALAGALDAPVLFTDRWSATQPALDAVDVLGPTSLIVVGGSGAVPDTVLQQLLGFSPLPPVVAGGAEDAIALDVFARINDERAARGIAPVAWDASLASDATAWSQTMAATGYRHDTVGAGIGENIHHPSGWCSGGACTYPTSGLLHHDWMQSQGNRDNIVEPGYVLAGVGIECGPDGTLWATVRFGVGFTTVSAGGSPATPVVHDDTAGFDCSGRHT